MMNFNGLNALQYGYHFHAFFAFILLVATILFMAWVIKFAKKEELRKWIIGLFIVGVLGCLITLSMGIFGMRGISRGSITGYGPAGMMGGNYFYGPGMMNENFLKCAQNQDCTKAVNEVMDRMMGEGQL